MESNLMETEEVEETENMMAIESIVLDTSTEENHTRDAFDESDALMVDAESSQDVTNSTYDADESQSTPQNAENGSDCLTEIKGKELDKLNDENVTNIVTEDCVQSIQTTNRVLMASPVASCSVPAPSSLSPNKIVYVKFIPKLTTSSTSPPKSTEVSPTKNKTEGKKVSPIKLTKDEPTTSIAASSATTKPVGHTVNLLNNNRILIKSVKNAHNPTVVAPTKCALTEGLAISATQMQTEPNEERKQYANESGEMSIQTAANVTDVIEPSDEEDVKCLGEAKTEHIYDSGLQIKIENILTENQTSDIYNKTLGETVSDKLSNATNSKIKREFEQLQKTVNESKVLSEFVIEHCKRNRRPAKSGKSKSKYNKSLDTNRSINAKMCEVLNRSVSPASSVSSISKESEQSAMHILLDKRNTRSMNMDFSAKQKRFLKEIQQETRGTDEETDNNSGIDDDDDLDYFAKQQTNLIERRKSIAVKPSNDAKITWDKYCWRCHQLETNMRCSCCIRTYHAPCLKIKLIPPAEMEKWQCPECIELKAAEKEKKKNRKYDVKHFNKLLKYAMNRILQDPNLQQFQFPVSKTQNPDYADVIINPMNLHQIETKIDNLVYTNSEAFMTDIKWILHNCSIYFADNYKVTRAAKALQKVSKQEVGDIETCAECYLNANTMTDNWFTETCAKPHLILWAKLKGFPYWPAKAMSINSTLVDVRFFGEHDRANIPSKDCFLYSREDPNPPTNKYKRNTIADCVKEVDVYIENITAKYGSFIYADVKTPFNPQMAEEHLFAMIPGLRTARGRRRSSTSRSDLTLKIVKTADNHLSVVKKGQVAKELPQVKRTIDITGDVAVSRTPTPPIGVLGRRKTSDTRFKRTKSTRHSDSKIQQVLNKSYQNLRRKSLAIEKLDQRRLNAIDITSALKKIQSSLKKSKPGSMPKKRKISTDHDKSSDTFETPEKSSRIDDSWQKTTFEEEKIDDDSQGNILKSVGLVKKTSAPATEAPTNDQNSTASATNSTCDTYETGTGPARKKSALTQRIINAPNKPLIPFVEVKKEPEDNDATDVSLDEVTSSSSSSQSLLLLPNRDSSAKNGTNADEAIVKTETSSDDDSLTIIEDTIANMSTMPAPLREQFMNNIRRGSIMVKDINKMTTNDVQATPTHARKSFPKGSSILKPRQQAPATATNKPVPMNNMVCIPLDGLPMSFNSSQPPPLSVVSNASLLTQNQTIQSNTPAQNMTTGPPPLSITALPSVNQPSLLNSNAINTISNGMITEQMASAVTDQIVRRQPPQLTARPEAPLRSASDASFPTEAGSVCKTLMENAHKMTDFFRTVIEDTLSDLVNMGNPEAKIRLLELEVEKQKNAHAKELAELKANTDRILSEMKKSMEKERARIVSDTRKQCELERIRSVDDAKRKQWCTVCLKEAQFYCCWNTSYCNYNCQRKHWDQHMTDCTQIQSTEMANQRKNNAKAKPDVRTQPQLSMLVKNQPQRDAHAIATGIRSNVRNSNNSMVPALRNILPKKSLVPINSTANQPRNQSANQAVQSQAVQAKQTPPQPCIFVSRPIGNWSAQSKPILHPNAIFLPSSQPYTPITNVSAGVSLLNTSNSQGQKAMSSEVITIP